MKRIFLVCLFYCFFRLPIYESIAAIFWQSASYVFKIHCRSPVTAVTSAVFDPIVYKNVSFDHLITISKLKSTEFVCVESLRQFSAHTPLDFTSIWLHFYPFRRRCELTENELLQVNFFLLE